MPLSRRSLVQVTGATPAGSLLAPFLSGRGLEASALGERFGGLDAAAPAPTVVRLDSNENPNGPGAAALAAVRGALGEAARYPRQPITALRAAVASSFGVAPDHILLGCGSTDILRAAVYAFTSPARALVTASPTFENPANDAERIGAPVRAIPVAASDLRLDLAAMADAAKDAGLVFLCNPNNPTSTVHGADAVKEFVARTLREAPDATILIDEAYHEYVDDPRYASAVPLALADPRVVVSRTFSKVYGMAGLRVGYAIGQPKTVQAMARHTLSIGVNQLGAAAALAGLGAREHVERERALNRTTRSFTQRAFESMGFRCAESQTNFLMVDLRRDSKPFRAACKESGVLVGRPFPPLDNYARVTIGTMPEMRHAVDVFKRALASA